MVLMIRLTLEEASAAVGFGSTTIPSSFFGIFSYVVRGGGRNVRRQDISRVLGEQINDGLVLVVVFNRQLCDEKDSRF